MRRQITDIQSILRRDGIDCCYVPSADDHNSECFARHFACAEFLSGLRSEAQELIVTQNEAFLWTDGRYFLQAEQELAGSGIVLMRSGEPGVPTLAEFLLRRAKELGGFTFCRDANVVPAQTDRSLRRLLEPEGVTFLPSRDLPGEVWEDRPAIVPQPIRRLPLCSCGRTASDKTAFVRARMKEAGADALLVSDLAETAWLFNLRGGDIECTPEFFAFTLVRPDTVELFTMIEPDSCVIPCRPRPSGTKNTGEDPLDFVTFRPYDQIFQAVESIRPGETLWISGSTCPAAIVGHLASGVRVLDEPTPIDREKAVKNPVELAATCRAHRKDARAMIRFLRILKEHFAGTDPSPFTELDAAAILDGLRAEEPGFLDLSFGTISAYGENAAIIHYAPTPETNRLIERKGFLLVDSGGQYVDGTTDITRTIACGPLTEEMKRCYTLVLKSHITLARSAVTEETTGASLDAASRAPLRAAGLDFAHGISHGVGHVLSVHEGPNGIRQNCGPLTIEPGNIQSDEPGYYKAGEFGIRIENELLAVPGPGAGEVYSGLRTDPDENAPENAGTKLPGDRSRQHGRFSFRTMTLVPYEREAIMPELLTEEELDWIDAYHEAVRTIMSPLLSQEDRTFLESAAAPLERGGSY